MRIKSEIKNKLEETKIFWLKGDEKKNQFNKGPK
jgi:hypothetical protein